MEGISQVGCHKGPVLFLTYVNDFPEGIRSYTNMFTDDTKLMTDIGDVKDCETLYWVKMLQ